MAIMKELTIEQANGTVIQELPDTLQSPMADLKTFEQEFTALCQKYGVELVPYIITFNNGARMADAKFVPIQK